MNVLVIAPHPDDETFGCGGSLCLHAERDDRVSCLFLTSGELALKNLPREEAWRIREAEAESAAEILGIQRLQFLRLPDWYLSDFLPDVEAGLRGVFESEAPGIVYCPHVAEWHPDHQAAFRAMCAVLDRMGMVQHEVRLYEIWTPVTAFDDAEDITGVMRRKMRAVRCYRSQMRGFRYDRAIRGLNQYRGALAKRTGYAEVFQSLSSTIRSEME